MAPKLNKLHASRWLAAKKFFANLLNVASCNGATIMFDGDKITPEQIIITDDAIFIKDQNVSVLIFEADPQADHGLYTDSLEFEKEMRARLMLVKELHW